MKRLYIFLVFAVTAPTAALWGADAPAAEKAPAPAPPPLSPRFKQVRDRIETLFEHRNEVPPPPDARLNPFRPPGPVLASDAKPPGTPGDPALPGSPVAEATGSDLTRLQQGVATLKVTGTSEKDGRLYIAINAKLYKDNDVIATQVQGEPVYLRIRQISRRGVTVVLNDAEMTLKF